MALAESARVDLALLLRLQVGARLQRLCLRLLQRHRVHRNVLQLVGQHQFGVQAQADGAQQLQARGAPRVLRHQQPLPVVGQLHARPRDLDARAGARRLLILRLLEHGLRKRHVGLRRFHVGVRPHRRQVGARHLRRHLLRASVHIRPGRAHAHLRRLEAPDRS